MKTIVFALLMVLFIGSSAIAEDTLKLVNANVYDSNENDQYAYALFKRGCKLFTGNDGCGVNGMPNHSFLVSQLRSDTSITHQFADSNDQCRQYLFFEDWYLYSGVLELMYVFQGYAKNATIGGIHVSLQNDTTWYQTTCNSYNLVDSVQFTGTLQDQISSYDNILYVSNVEGLRELTFTPWPVALTYTDSINSHTSIGAHRLGDTLYEVTTTHYGADEFTIVIRDANSLSTVIDDETYSETGWGVANDPTSFVIIKDTFDISGKDISTLGLFAVEIANEDCRLYIFNLTGGEIDLLKNLDLDDLFWDLKSVSDVSVMDKFAVVEGRTSTDHAIIIIYDISTPDTPTLVHYKKFKPNTSSSYPIMNYVYNNTDSSDYAGDCYHISFTRNIVQDGSDWEVDDSYYIFGNWPVGPKDGDYVEELYGVLWQFEFIPEYPPASFTIGDVNNTSSINVSDVTAITAYMNHTESHVYSPLSRYDINSDGVITFADARRLSWYLFGNGETPGPTCFDCQH